MPNGDDEKKQKKAQQSKNLVQDYIDSDIFRKRQENFLSQRYDNMSSIVKGIGSLFGEDKQSYVKDYADEFVNEMRERSENMPDPELKDLSFGTNAQFGKDDGEYFIRVNENIQEERITSSVAHEGMHSLYDAGFFTKVGDSPFPGEVNDAYDNYSFGDSSEKVSNKIKKAFKEGDDYDKYQYEPKEIRAEVWGSRFQLHEDLKKIRKGEFDDFIDDNPYKHKETDRQKKRRKKLEVMQKWIKNADIKSPVKSEFNQSHLDILRELRPSERMLNQFDDSTVINLMNIIADRSKDFSGKATQLT